jgi:hypothetical protein
MVQAGTAFEALKKVPLSKLPKFLDILLTIFPPRRTKVLNTKFVNDVMSIREPRLLVITGHSYLDYILVRMIEKESNQLTQWQRKSFRKKLESLNCRAKFDDDIYECLVEINRLRNLFAHDFFMI